MKNPFPMTWSPDHPIMQFKLFLVEQFKNVSSIPAPVLRFAGTKFIDLREDH